MEELKDGKIYIFKKDADTPAMWGQEFEIYDGIIK